MSKYIDFVNFLNNRFNHNLLMLPDKQPYINNDIEDLCLRCSICNTYIEIWNCFDASVFENGILFKNKMYEIYTTGVMNPLKLENILTCNEQIVKNMLE